METNRTVNDWSGGGLEVVAWCQRCGVQEDEPRDADELTRRKRPLYSLPFASLRVHSWFFEFLLVYASSAEEGTEGADTLKELVCKLEGNGERSC
jgi:hypothetical protein